MVKILYEIYFVIFNILELEQNIFLFKNEFFNINFIKQTTKKYEKNKGNLTIKYEAPIAQWIARWTSNP